jgi:hypothetical protein
MTIKKAKPFAKIAYDKHSTAIQLAMADLQCLMCEHLEKSGGQPNWAHVGDLEHVRQQLTELNNFLKNEDEG